MFVKPGRRPRDRWTVAQITRIKAAVRAELEPMAKDPKRRIAHILARIRDLEDEAGSEQRLRCFVYTMSALVQHQQRRCLKPSQVEGLVTRATIILNAQGIVPGVSQAAFLYGELHQVRSLIHRRSGETWAAAWEQQMASFLARGSTAADAAFAALALGTRALRLGDAALAVRELERAEAAGLAAESQPLARITMVRALRLSGRVEAAEAVIEGALAEGSLREEHTLELTWERLCLQARADGDPRSLVLAVGRRGSHYHTAYILEAFFHAASVSRKEAMERMASIHALSRRERMRPRRAGFMLEAALAVEECYDKDVPLVLRLGRLGRTLARVRLLTNVDKELLVWAAAARWLARIHSFKLAALALGEYETLSRRLTGGRDGDTMRVAADLLASDWYTHADGASDDEIDEDAHSFFSTISAR